MHHATFSARRESNRLTTITSLVKVPRRRSLNHFASGSKIAIHNCQKLLAKSGVAVTSMAFPRLATLQGRGPGQQCVSPCLVFARRCHRRRRTSRYVCLVPPRSAFWRYSFFPRQTSNIAQLFFQGGDEFAVVSLLENKVFDNLEQAPCGYS